jgi:hypothetical protein
MYNSDALFCRESTTPIEPTEFFVRIANYLQIEMPLTPNTFDPRIAAKFVDECFRKAESETGNPPTEEMIYTIGKYACRYLFQRYDHTAYAIVIFNLESRKHSFDEETKGRIIEKIAKAAVGNLKLALQMYSETCILQKKYMTDAHHFAYGTMQSAFETIYW